MEQMNKIEDTSEHIDYVKFAKNLITVLLGNDEEPTTMGAYTILEINSGNNKLLLEHIKAINGILNKAIEELEKEGNNENRKRNIC